MKPWKQDAIWILGVLQWIAQWCDEASIFDEDLTALMVPAVLSIIDDDAITFKARGCDILRHLLRPMKAARSDYLERTNLDDVFVQALKPSLLSLPTLNSEDESVYILSRAYPAICEVVMTRYHMRTPQHSRQGSREIQDGPPARPETNSPSPSEREEFHDEKRFTVLQKLLSDDLTRSYRLTARLDSANGATSASFPYPALSRLLLEEMILVISLMKTHVIPRMDDVVETIRLTLTNPFIAADLDLLATALELTRDLVLNAWTRAWDMHIIMLDALTSVWVRLMEDQPEFVTMDQTNGITHTDRDRRAHRQHVSILRWIKATLRGTLASLRIASQENGPALAAKNRRLVELRECGTYDPRRQPESETESSVELSDDEGQQDRWNRLMDEAEGTDNQGERMDADGNDEEEEDGDEGNDDEEDYTEEEGIVWPNANEDEHEREKREELMARRIEAQFQRERKEDFLRFDLEMKALLDNEDRLDELVGWLLKEKDAEGRQAVEAPYAH
ncbi:hypothetical protein KEM55_009100 [Ascosphaera atra]|nr:hypothetical protein KEM55_009100 [Ascosphaera atra]